MRTMQRSIDIGIPPRSITSNINYSCELCAGAYFSGKMGGLNKAFDADSGLCLKQVFKMFFTVDLNVFELVTFFLHCSQFEE